MKFIKGLTIASITGHERTIKSINKGFLYFNDGYHIHSKTMRQRINNAYYIIKNN